MRLRIFVLIVSVVSLVSLSWGSAFAQNHGGHGNHGGGGNSGGGGNAGPGGDNHSGHGPGQLQQGRYVGYLKLDGRGEKIALQADFFLESPEDFTQFPQLEANFKVSLGGYHTAEYLTYAFRNVRYDFDNGSLTLDEPANDLIFTAKVHAMGGRTHLEGKVWSRTSAMSGTLELMSESDEPENEPGDKPSNDNTPFAPLLDGQYRGKCDGKAAAFQVQTARGLASGDSADGIELFDYEIVARLGYRKAGMKAGESRPWEVNASFAGGSYDPYRGKLVFMGPSSTAIECVRQQGRLACSYRIQGGKVRCEFDKEDKTIRQAAVFPRRFRVTPTAEQRKELPSAGTVPDAALASLLDGHYTGYLHHEASDRYQDVAMHVVASVSTENPHNPNKVFVSATSVLYYGAAGSDHFISQRYEPRSFYVRPGFVLNAPGTDSFIAIEQWKTGYIRGVWYSQAFGRVGTVEFVKGEVAPLPAKALMIPSWRGEFQASGDSTGKPGRWFSLIVPNAPAERLKSTVVFVGSYQSILGSTKIEPIERGSFDPYTGRLAWKFSENEGVSMVSGRVLDSGDLEMYWPPAPRVFGVGMTNYSPDTFQKLRE